jgi:hypothetical protein
MVWEQVGRKHVRNRAEAGIKKSRKSKQRGNDVEIRGKNAGIKSVMPNPPATTTPFRALPTVQPVL